jgi:general secretion pathway protein C
MVKKLSANRFLVNREDVTAAVGNINQFMTQARIKPHFVTGRPSGFSVSEIQPGSLMEKLGLQNDDVIKKVNGEAITKPEEVFQAYSQLQRDSNIEVEIERGNRSEVFRYEIR